MRIALTLLLLITSCCSVAPAADGDDTLRLLLSKSPLIVVGKIEEHSLGARYEAGVANHLCTVSVTEVLHGDPNLKDKDLKVNIVRMEYDAKDRHPLIRKEAECLLFLTWTKNTPSCETSDAWFGIQHASPAMTKALAQLSAELKAKAPKYQ